MVEGLVNIAIRISGAVPGLSEHTLDKCCLPHRHLPPIMGVISGSGLVMVGHVGEYEEQDRVVARRQIVRFNPAADVERTDFNCNFNPLPPNYSVEKEDDGYYLCFKPNETRRGLFSTLLALL
jgi:hypothetical protein